jgi:hypothetical protein
MAAPASRQRAASAPISAALTGSPGCASLVVSAPTPATVMISFSITTPCGLSMSFGGDLGPGLYLFQGCDSAT